MNLFTTLTFLFRGVHSNISGFRVESRRGGEVTLEFLKVLNDLFLHEFILA